MNVTHKVSIDLLRPGIEPRINAVQDDKYSRSLEIALFSGGAAWEIPQDATAVIQYRKSDGNGGTYNTLPNGSSAYEISGNVITVALAPQVLNVAGIVLLSVKLTQGSKELNTFTVIMQVHPNPGSNISVSEPYFNVPGLMPTPPYAKTGQYFRVGKTTKNGQVASVVAVDIPFCVSISKNPDGSYSADKTRLEAVAAYEAGIPVFCDIPVPGAFINAPIRIPLVQNLFGNLTFETVYQATQYRVFYSMNDAVYPNVDNVIIITATPLATEEQLRQLSSQNAGLSTAQVEALHGMFKVCAFIKNDVSAEYTAFLAAFGLADSGDDPGEEDTHTHNYTSAVTTAATCTTAGVRTYACSCGERYTESIPATGHNYVDGVCTVCGAADPDAESGGSDSGEATEGVSRINWLLKNQTYGTATVNNTWGTADTSSPDSIPSEPDNGYLVCTSAADGLATVSETTVCVCWPLISGKTYNITLSNSATAATYFNLFAGKLDAMPVKGEISVVDGERVKDIVSYNAIAAGGTKNYTYTASDDEWLFIKPLVANVMTITAEVAT